MTTKLKNYRINITDDAQPGDALVVWESDGFVTCHMGTSAGCDIWTSCWNVPVLDENWKIPSASIPSVVMRKEVYDQCCCNADAFNYENFYNTPEIPEVFDPVVTFTQGWVTKWSISLNQASPTVISLDAGWVTAGCAIDIYNSKVSVKYDWTTIWKNNCNEICVVDYDTIKQWATCWASAVQANDLATVAMSWKYCDLEGKPEIPSAQIQSDWEQANTNLADYIKNKPTIGNATITLQKNGTDVDTFTLNQTANKCLNLVLDKCDVWLSNVDNTSDADKPVSDATLCALACKQDNISDLNTIRSNACAGKTASETIANYWDIVTHNSCEYATATQGWKADTAVQPGDLCTVATSGKYCDLSWQPTIPTDNCQLANSCWYITNSVSNLTNYYLKCETYKKCEVDNLIANFGWFEVVSTLPSTNIKTNVIYLLWPIWTGPDKYEEWIYYNNTWTKIWETTTDLSNYAKCCDVPTDNCQLWNSCWYTTCIGTVVASDIANLAKCCDVPTDNCQLSNSCWYTTCTWTLVAWDLAPYAKSCTLCTVATSWCYCDLGGIPSLATVATTGCYNDLTGTPTIPTKVSQLSNDCNYIDNTVNNLTNYTPTCSLANVATSWAYCDLSWTPSLACVACSGSYEDLCCKPNLWVYQTTANMVCTLANADDNHYPSAKTVADALSCAWAWDMLSTMYDPNGKCADAFDYCNFINTPNLATVATSGKYCDLSWTPTIPAELTAGCAISVSSNKINVNYDWATIKKNSWNCLYADFTGLATTASLCPVATSWKYCDLTWTPTIPTNNNQLTNGCGYTTCTGTLVASDLTPYAKTCTLCTVATSGKYCDLTGTPSLCTVATSGKYCDLTWQPTIPTVNTKTFTLSSASDTTNASAAAAYINWWNNAIVLYNWQAYVLSSKTSTQMVFKWQTTSTANTSNTSLSQSTLTFTVSWNNVSAISATATSLWSYLETNRNYWTAFTPTCAGHPATKKYVDDAIAGVGWQDYAEWSDIFIEGGELPDWYTQLEYAQSDWTFWINTWWLYDWTSDLKLEARFMWTAYNWWWAAPFWLQNAWYVNWIYPFYAENTTIFSYLWNITRRQQGYYHLYKIYTVRFITEDNTFVREVNGVDEWTAPYDKTTVSTTAPLFIFSWWVWTTATNNFSWKIYSLRIRKTGILDLNLIPAKRNSDNAIGMYDVVHNNFFTNAALVWWPVVDKAYSLNVMNIIVDDWASTVSQNPVSNKAITTYVNNNINYICCSCASCYSSCCDNRTYIIYE